MKKEDRTTSNYEFEEQNQILLPQFNRIHYTAMETIMIDAETSLIFLADSQKNLNFFSKKSLAANKAIPEDDKIEEYTSSIQ